MDALLADDLDLFFDTSELAALVVWSTGTVTREIVGILQRDPYLVEAALGGVQTYQALVTCKSADVFGIAAEHTITAAGQAYEVGVPQVRGALTDLPLMRL